MGTYVPTKRPPLLTGLKDDANPLSWMLLFQRIAIGCKGAGKTPGDNAQKLAKVIAAAIIACELSLLAALSIESNAGSYREIFASSQDKTLR